MTESPTATNTKFHLRRFRQESLGRAIWTLVVCVTCSSNVPAQTPEQVNRAIDNGVSFLKSRQRAGGWEELPNYEGGTTALATLALLNSGVPVTDPVIQQSLDRLRRAPLEQTYVVSLIAMVFAEASPKQEFARIKKCADWLMEARLPNARWSYEKPGGRGIGGGDNSNSQFAMLGMQAARQSSVDVPKAFWVKSRSYWSQTQGQEGGWGYMPGTPATGSMTTAGVSSLIIANRSMDSVREGKFAGKPIRCNGAEQDDNIERGIGWLGRNFSTQGNPFRDAGTFFYYFYGVERAGRLSGRRYMGEHDWYRVGARVLTSPGPFGQRPNGSWITNDASDLGAVCNTSFALLFLSKGRIPIVVNKLQFGPGSDWNNAPNDVHNLTQFLAQRWNVRLNWQIVDGQVSRIDDLLQAPVLQMSGHEAPKLSAAEKELLRQFVAEGGLLMADANCSVGAFDEGFRALCKEIFTEPGQELRRLEPEHGVWSSLFKLSEDWPLFGIDVGCRTGVFYSPQDLSCQWEHADEPDSQTALKVGANIIAYAVGPEDLRDKLEDRIVVDKVQEDTIKRNFLQIAKLKHNGDWNPAPLAIRNLMASLREVVKVDVIAQERVIDLVDPNLTNYPLAYMHGRSRFQFDRREKETLASYTSTGGVLFVDACCGNERFDESFRQMIKEVYPDNPLQPIPPEHEIFTTKVGYDLSKVKQGSGMGGGVGKPSLEGVEVDGRYVVIYSKYDLGCALQKQQSKDCKGYTHESALQIASNIALYALKQ
ncbi:DUF4159 domain-containing protein [bacterium]|nr:DUF4159 domain-containing protein [bacterium]